MTISLQSSRERGISGVANHIEYNQKDLTFFVPTLNEAQNILPTLDTIHAAMTGLNFDYEILVFDDGSTDATVAIVEEKMKSHPEIRLVVNRSRRGLGFNYFRGAFFAKGRHYMLINGDNVEPRDTIRAIVEQLGKAELVIPFFGTGDHRSAGRRNTSRFFTFLVNQLSGNKINYYNGPVLHVTDNVRFWRAETVGYGYQAELLCKLLNEKATYVEVEVKNSDRQWGFSKAFSLRNFLSVSNSLFHILWRRLEYGVFNLLEPGILEEHRDARSQKIAKGSVGGN